MLLRNTPIQRKLVVIILLTTALALLLMRSAFFVYEYLTFREATLRLSETLARVIAANSTAVLTFGDEQDAEETLSAFRAEGSLVVAVCLNRSFIRSSTWALEWLRSWGPTGRLRSYSSSAHRSTGPG
jgi:hypothetical protein